MTTWANRIMAIEVRDPEYSPNRVAVSGWMFEVPDGTDPNDVEQVKKYEPPEGMMTPVLQAELVRDDHTGLWSTASAKVFYPDGSSEEMATEGMSMNPTDLIRAWLPEEFPATTDGS